MRSPDASWVRRERWEALTDEEREKFPPLAPDFVIEIRSATDRLRDLREKMQEYVDQGVRLGWLIDPTNRRVEIYRPGKPPEALDGPTTVNGDPELPGFVLDLSPIW
jgi:Uma2 family endonuclease